LTVPGAEHDHSFDVFGTRVRVLLVSGSSSAARLDALRVQALLQTVHRTLTRFAADSELSRLNARTGEEVAVSPMLLRAVQAALWAAQLSDGLVDPTVLRDLERAGYATSRARRMPAALADAIAAAPARRPAAPRSTQEWATIEVDTQRRTIRVPAGVRLDLGGSAKGLAVDLAAGLLSNNASFAIDAGGDIRIGAASPCERLVHISHPLEEEVVHSFAVFQGAVATSGLRTRVWRNGGGFAHHLIDPARGTPAWTGVIQATALAPTTLEAETLAKTALLRGLHAGRQVLAPHGGALILDDGELICVGGLDAVRPRPVHAG
jgi:thiamine biosynthesis lipoprotein